ncbi:hypothetical protein EC912_11256 [Luteibacter rhizovicinus]|uniref:Integral membrane protein n=2 Tax=Luteibacter rhizovicinus TaxID=242606 RepID=A0A4R3YGM8_9GAMM|nr:hypothetical protein EC912_11256 [Luteibacter rhizovicinus]
MNDVLACAGAFFAGAFLFNAIPHLAAGLQGMPFPTPFSRPRGVGPSSPWVNVLWGMFNLIAGLILLTRHPVEVGANALFISACVGALALGSYTAVHFGRVRAQGTQP